MTGQAVETEMERKGRQTRELLRGDREDRGLERQGRELEREDRGPERQGRELEREDRGLAR